MITVQPPRARTPRTLAGWMPNIARQILWKYPHLRCPGDQPTEACYRALTTALTDDELLALRLIGPWALAGVRATYGPHVPRPRIQRPEDV